jgi:putative membrane protein
MIDLLNSKNWWSIFSIWLVTIAGMIGIYLGYVDWFVSKTPMNLILGMLLLYWNFPPKNGWISVMIWIVVYLIGMGVEVVGVNTALLFGSYQYGENLGYKIFGVPVLIGINWVVLTFLTASISRRFFSNKWLAVFCGAALMVLLDLFIEPIAPIFDFWSWELGYAPIRNFVDWFIVSFVMQVIVRNELPDESASFPIHHLASQFVFFIFFCLLF